MNDIQSRDDSNVRVIADEGLARAAASKTTHVCASHNNVVVENMIFVAIDDTSQRHSLADISVHLSKKPAAESTSARHKFTTQMEPHNNIRTLL